MSERLRDWLDKHSCDPNISVKLWNELKELAVQPPIRASKLLAILDDCSSEVIINPEDSRLVTCKHLDIGELEDALAAQPETKGEALSENVRKAFEGEFHVSVDQEYDGYVQVRVGTEFASDEQAEFVERAIRAALAATGGKRG